MALNTLSLTAISILMCGWAGKGRAAGPNYQGCLLRILWHTLILTAISILMFGWAGKGRAAGPNYQGCLLPILWH
jgi:hypothetical protein